MMIFLRHFVSRPPIFVDDVDALWYPVYSMRNTIHKGKRYTAAAAPADNKICTKIAWKMILFFFTSLRRFCPFPFPFRDHLFTCSVDEKAERRNTRLTTINENTMFRVRVVNNVRQLMGCVCAMSMKLCERKNISLQILWTMIKISVCVRFCLRLQTVLSS